jgi:predicted DNA-binding transcriptional regulator AlpA
MSTSDGGNEGSQTAHSGAATSLGRRAVPPLSTGGLQVLLTDDQAAALLGVSTRKFHDLRREPWMVQPVQLGPRLLRWPRAELEAAIARMPRQAAPGAEPAQLRRQRIERAKRDGCLA